MCCRATLPDSVILTSAIPLASHTKIDYSECAYSVSQIVLVV